MYILLIFFTALVFSLVTIPLLIRFAQAKNIFDQPDDHLNHSPHLANSLNHHSRRVHTKPIPRLGGIAIVLGFFVSLLIWKIPTNMMVIFGSSFILFLTGLVDDIHPLSAKIRLFIQICVSIASVYFIKLDIHQIYFFQSFQFELPYFVGFSLSVFIIMGAINSINMIDGLDGLAGGVTLIGISLLSYLHFLNTHNIELLIVFSVPIVGAILGFLKYNTHPSSIFMGDCGSNWLGFMIGILMLLIANNFLVLQQGGHWVLQSSAEITNNLPFLSLIMCVSIPVFDTAHVILTRLSEGKNPMVPDKRHFHHSLMKIGFTHSQSVIAIYFLMILFGILGILPVAYPQYHFEWTPVTGLILLTLSLYFAHKLNVDFIAKLVKNKIFLTSEKRYGAQISLGLRYWENANRYVIYIILFATPIFAGVVPKPLGMTAAAMSVILAGTLFFKKSFSFFESLLIAIAATVLLTANNSNIIWIEFLGHKYMLQSVYNGLFIGLLASSILFFIVTFKRNYLIIAPTDFLLVTLPLLLLLLPTHIQAEYKLNIIALRSLVLFAALRTLGKRHIKFFYKIHFICIIALAWVALTSLFGLRVVY